tara:strand:- start:1548 stop:2711 length:1164 start_codon:yes stop_codon:yes gene_type:complete
MSHYLEEYAKCLGVKASKPVTQNHFFPVVAEKYITISSSDEIQSKHYNHFPLVLDLLRPHLHNLKIKVIQIEGKAALDGVECLLNASFRQKCFVMSRSLLHIGSDGVFSHLASSKSVPTVNLFGNVFANNNRPLFSGSSLNINLEPDWKIKPCFSNVDPNMEINKIKPETVAQAVLDLLNIKQKITFSTISIGDGFGQKICEVVPTCFSPLKEQHKQSNLFLRLDYGFNDDAFVKYCQNYKIGIISDKIINPQMLTPLAKNISRVCIFVGDEWETGDRQSHHIPQDYFKFLKSQNIECLLLVKNDELLGKARNAYFDQMVKPYKATPPEKPSGIKNESKFISSKIIVEGDKEYLSYAHWKKGLDNNNKVIDTEAFWEELEHFYIYEH